ncbi:MAG: hypothetical protein ACU841_00230 [Gammaproteobacteria bacterium]
MGHSAAFKRFSALAGFSEEDLAKNNVPFCLCPPRDIPREERREPFREGLDGSILAADIPT